MALNSLIKPPPQTNMFYFVLNFFDLAIFVEKKMGKFVQIQKKKVNNKKNAKTLKYQIWKKTRVLLMNKISK